MGDHHQKTNLLINFLSSIWHNPFPHALELFLISCSVPLLLLLLGGFFPLHLLAPTLEDFVQLRAYLTRNTNVVTLFVFYASLFFLGTFYFITRPRKVYLVDFACYKPSPELMCSRKEAAQRVRDFGVFNEDNLAFMEKILERAGIGEKTYFPEAFFGKSSNPTMAEARKEAEMVIFGSIDQLLAKTGVKANDIGILVVNCGVFCPTPSLASVIVNHYKLRSNILSYNIGGMGCSAGIISIDLVKHHLQMYRNSYAIVVSLENLTLNAYKGNNPSMLVANSLFRVGGAAILLSNKFSDRRRSKYQLTHLARTHNGADDRSYRVAVQQEDEAGKVGIALSKELMVVAGQGLKLHIAALGPLILPMSEQIFFFLALVARKTFKIKKINPYIPDFKLALEHFCIHAGGRAVLDEMEKALNLTPWHMEPSRMTLYRFGNTSTSSIWYELAYMEAKGRIKRGDRTWQISFGAGFKCNSAVWRAMRTIDPSEEKINPWIDEIDDFPVEVPKIQPLDLS